MDVFCEIPCLTEQTKRLEGAFIQKKWFKSADRRIIGQYLQKFMDYNARPFQFLGVQPRVVGTDYRIALTFRTSSYVGAVPLRAADTGRQIGDFVVVPRFAGGDRFEDYIGIIQLVDKDISPQFMDSLPLVSGRNYRPPLYLEAVKFIALLEKVARKPWQKFDNREMSSHQPIGQVNWKKYIENAYKADQRLRFPVRKNVLSEFHSDYAALVHVFEICKNELRSAHTPSSIKSMVRDKLRILEERLSQHRPQAMWHIPMRSLDRPIVKTCKAQANRILDFHLVKSTAWRVDFSEVFEVFTQYIFRRVAEEIGGRLQLNPQFHTDGGPRYAWQLQHIEPDAVFQRGEVTFFIDAKYKSHLYNSHSNSERLKNDHRHDLHQIMAYSSFSQTKVKVGCLCYPSSRATLNSTQYINPFNGAKTTILILGIPLKTTSVTEVKTLLIAALRQTEKHISG